MIAMQIEAETVKLESALDQYVRLSGMVMSDALKKQGGKFAYMLSKGLQDLTKPKGEIRSERLAALAAGGGLIIRQSVRNKVMAKYGAHTTISDRQVRIFRGKKAAGSVLRKGKHLNLQALLVLSELNLRESGRGFLSLSARFPVSLKVGSTTTRSRFGPLLALAGLAAQKGSAFLEFIWGKLGKMSQSSAQGLSKPRAESVIAKALQGTTEDVMIYVNRKLSENISKSNLR